MKKAESLLREALAESGMVIPLSSKGRGGYLEFLCRQVPGQEGPWITTVEELLRWCATDDSFKDFLIARRYLLKADRMVFGWFMSFDFPSASKLETAVMGFTEALRKLSHQAALSQPLPPIEAVRAPTEASKSRAVPSKGPSPVIKIIRRGVDEEGRVFEESEMPLPHVPKDLNTPSKPVWSETHGKYVGGGKGAKFTGGGR